jgi:hypothetical protein
MIVSLVTQHLMQWKKERHIAIPIFDVGSKKVNLKKRSFSRQGAS